MKKDEKCDWDCKCNHKWHHSHRAGGVVYCLGFIGAAIYYISNATSFWMGVLGVLKALVWPAFLVYHGLKFLGV
ncbi:MAG: hypothetical protein AABX85_00635 [Nanoarchaeota archaeon]